MMKILDLAASTVFAMGLAVGLLYLGSYAGYQLGFWTMTPLVTYLAAYGFQLCLWPLIACNFLFRVVKRIIPEEVDEQKENALKFFFAGWLSMLFCGYVLVVRPEWGDWFGPVWSISAVLTLAFFFASRHIWNKALQPVHG